MSYDYELKLIKQDIEIDEIGNSISKDDEVVILCDKRSVGRLEFYNAAMAGLKPTLNLIVHSLEFNEEKIVEFEGIRYRVIKTYEINSDEVELTCERCETDG